MGYDYDLVVIGGGAAGLVASKLGAGLGKKVAIVEKSRLGGECTLYGCVPSKALIKTARVYKQMGDPEAVGLGFTARGAPPASPYTTDGVFPRVRSIIERVYRGHNPEVLERLGIELIIGLPRFLDRHHIGLEKRVVSARSFIICTGSSPLVPAIPGIDAVPYLTNETLFDLDGLPASMAVLGAGPIGMEMAQAFAYLGTAVTVIEAGNRILAREDVELADLLACRMAGHGVELLTGTKAVGAKRDGEKIDVAVEDASGRRSLVVEKLLVAVGRRPNIEGLDLEAAGIEYSQKGIKADDHMRTTGRNIYTCGDVTGPYQFSHMAEYQARIAARDALVPFKATASYDNYIWCTFTDPEFAHAGLTEEEARAKHTGVRVYRWKFADTDRGKTEGDEFGMAKFICDRKGMLLGAHILGDRAGELIHEAQILKTFGIPFHKLDSVIHVYPTLTDVVRQPAKMAHIDRLRNNPLIRIARRLFGKK